MKETSRYSTRTIFFLCIILFFLLFLIIINLIAVFISDASLNKNSIFAFSIFVSVLIFALILKMRRHFLQGAAGNSNDSLEPLIEHSQAWFWQIDVLGKLAFSNSVLTNILGYQSQELIGTSLFLLVDLEDRKKATEAFKESVKMQKGWTDLLLKWQTANGALKQLKSSSIPIFDSTGRLAGFKGLSEDLNEQLAGEKTKSNIISVLSRELRGPLASIHGSLGLLNDKKRIDLPREIQELLGIAYCNSKKMTQVIEDILDSEKILSNELDMHFSNFDLIDTIQEAINACYSTANQYNIDLTTAHSLKKCVIHSDKERLLQVLTNLITNAIKFSPPDAQVVIKAEEIQGSIRVSVKDSGKGIASEFISKVFQDFPRTEENGTRPIQGTGISLNLCKKIIEKLGGHIHFTTEKGQGSVFYFELPKTSEKKSNYQFRGAH